MWESRLACVASWATIVGVPIALASLVVVLWAGNDGEPVARVTVATPQPAPARLTKVDMVVRNEVDPNARPAIELMLHNTGDRRVVVSRARLEIRRVAPLPLCFTQGDLPSSNRYGAQLPVDAQTGDVVEVPVHQQLGADRADHFEIALGVTGPGGRDELEGLYLFEVRVSLVHDGGHGPLPLGRALVSLPSAPIQTVHYWTHETPAHLQGYNPTGRRDPHELFPASLMDCWRSNTAALSSLLGDRSVRSDELEEISRTLATPSYAALEAAN